jgi:hypothetical protein
MLLKSPSRSVAIDAVNMFFLIVRITWKEDILGILVVVNNMIFGVIQCTMDYFFLRLHSSSLKKQ